MLLYLTPDERECLYPHTDVRTLSALARTCKTVGNETRPLLPERKAAFLFEHLCILKPSFSWRREGLACVGRPMPGSNDVLPSGILEARQEHGSVCVVPTLDLTAENVRSWRLPMADRHDRAPVFPDLEVTDVAQSAHGDAVTTDGTRFKPIVLIVVTLRSSDGVTLRLEGDVSLVSYRRWDLRRSWALREDGASRAFFQFPARVTWERAVVV